MTDTCGTFEDADHSYYFFIIMASFVFMIFLTLLPIILFVWILGRIYERYKPNISYYKK